MSNKNELELLLRFLKNNPNDPNIHFKLGNQFLMYNELSKALIHFKISIDNDSENSKYWLYYLFTLFRLDKRRALKQSIKKLKEKNLEINILEVYNLKDSFSEIDKFILNFINYSGFYISNKFKISNYGNERLALLTNTFLFWFETQTWINCNLLELGAGNSTFYFSNHFKRVTSYESNKIWIQEIEKEIPKNVKLIKNKNLVNQLKKENLNAFEVILIDSSENRASLTKEIINQKYEGLLFFDNSDTYRNSIKMLTNINFIEIPFFGIKPIEGNISCTSLLIRNDKLRDFFNPNWVNYPYLTYPLTNNLWDKT